MLDNRPLYIRYFGAGLLPIQGKDGFPYSVPYAHTNRDTRSMASLAARRLLGCRRYGGLLRASTTTSAPPGGPHPSPSSSSSNTNREFGFGFSHSWAPSPPPPMLTAGAACVRQYMAHAQIRNPEGQDAAQIRAGVRLRKALCAVLMHPSMHHRFQGTVGLALFTSPLQRYFEQSKHIQLTAAGMVHVVTNRVTPPEEWSDNPSRAYAQRRQLMTPRMSTQPIE
jgi:hypothetical protein